MRISLIAAIAASIIAVLIVSIAATIVSRGEAPVLSGLCFSPFLSEDPEVSEPVRGLLDEVAPYTGGIRTFSSTGEWAEITRITGEKGLYTAAGAGLCGDRGHDIEQVEDLVELVESGHVDLAVVGDETLLWDLLSEERLISYMRQVRDAGVPVTTSDGWQELLDHPRVMREVDVVIMNVYPFWEGVSLADSIEYIDSAYREVKEEAGDKEVIVETGWPSAGESLGEAVPGSVNAGRYLREFERWAESEGVRYFYFEAFDEPWKAAVEGSVGAHWGLWDRDGNMKQYARQVLEGTP